MEAIKKKAFLVGLNYKNDIYNERFCPELEACWSDCDKFKQLLMDHCGFQEENIVVLTDREGPPSEADFRRTMYQAAGGIQGQEDVMVIYFAGHTLPTPEGCLLYLGNKIFYKDLKDFVNYLAGHQGQLVTVVLDCCFAEAVFGKLDELDPNATGSIVVISACRDEEESKHVKDDDGNLTGALTHFLVKVINENGGPISNVELVTQINNSVDEFTRQHNEWAKQKMKEMEEASEGEKEKLDEREVYLEDNPQEITLEFTMGMGTKKFASFRIED